MKVVVEFQPDPKPYAMVTTRKIDSHTDSWSIETANLPNEILAVKHSLLRFPAQFFQVAEPRAEQHRA